MEIGKNKTYYKKIKTEDICENDYCKNYISQIKKEYPKTTEYLDSIGVDIEKPFKVVPLKAEDKMVYYEEAQYIVLGNKNNFKNTKIGRLKIEITDSHPETNIDEEHYVIKLSPIAVKNNLSIKEDKKDTKAIIKILFKKCKFQTIMLIISCLIAAWGILTTSLAYGLKIYLSTLLVLIIPVVVFGIALYRKYKFINNERAKSNINWFTTFALLLLPVYYLFTLFFLSIEFVTTDVTNYKYYKDFMYKDLYEVFPKKIPKDAENISFFHRDPFLQGGGINALSYKDKSLTASIVDEKYKSKSIWIGNYQNEEIPEAVNEDHLFSNLSIDGKIDNFTIYVYEARCDDSGWCNHGEYMLVAYNDITKEIIYKEENW